MDVYTKFPSQSSARTNGITFMYKGSMTDLQPTSIFEGVNCVDGSEDMDTDCHWVHADTCGADCATIVRTLYGYDNQVRATLAPQCALGNELGQGSEPAGPCSKYPVSHQFGGNNPSILGWQADVQSSFCWAARGNCCSDSGGSGRCFSGGDAAGSAYSMLWVG
jgi:hypothetical protein